MLSHFGLVCPQSPCMDSILNFFNSAPQPARSSADETFTADRSCLPELESLYPAWVERCYYHERNIITILKDRTSLIRQGYGCVHSRCSKQNCHKLRLNSVIQKNRFPTARSRSLVDFTIGREQKRRCRSRPHSSLVYVSLIFVIYLTFLFL